MRLLDDIIAGAVDGQQPIADVLRKCLVLAFQLKNNRLKEWVEKELNGYERNDALPDYRDVPLHSFGNFQGGGGAWLPKRPLPLAPLDKKHRDYVKAGKFVQPIASYDSRGKTDETQNAIMNWAPDLIAQYQEKYIRGYVLVQAWQEVPAAVMVSLVETVRNRVLRFALELQEELGAVSDKVEELPKAKVEQAVTNYIYGGTNIIGGVVHDVSQMGNISIQAGNFAALVAALKTIGIGEADVAALKSAIKEDQETSEGMGAKVAAWLKGVGSAGSKVAMDVGKEFAKKWVMQYLGLDGQSPPAMPEI